jgi:hypothetical protein
MIQSYGYQRKDERLDAMESSDDEEDENETV